jgi:hypothetical protein
MLRPLAPSVAASRIARTLGLAVALAAATAGAEIPSPAAPPATAAPGAPASTAPAFALRNTAAPPSTAGPERAVTRLRPEKEAARACSFTAPVCVHTTAAVPGWAAHQVLVAAENALSAYRAMGLPMPLPDGTRGGSPAYDIYVGIDDGPAATLPDPETEPRITDQAAAYTLLPTPSTWGCDARFDLAQRVAEALVWRLDAGAERGFVAAATSYLASLVAPCAARETPAIDAFQAEPWRAITEPAPGPAHGGLLFPMYLEENEGGGAPGQLLMSLFAIATQKSPPASYTYQNEPDVLDALRSSLRFRRGSLDDLLLDFAVDRAFVGNRSDGAHLPATELYDAAGRVFFEWSIPYASLPRHLAPAHPLEPTGATYLWVDLADAPKDAEITFVADWELPAVYRWSLVKVDKNGAETGRIDIASIFGTSHVERTAVLKDELAGILIVGTYADSLDRSQPFDPDEAPFMPHSYEVTIYGPTGGFVDPHPRGSDHGGK